MVLNCGHMFYSKVNTMSNNISSIKYQRNIEPFWLSSDVVYCLLKSRLVGSLTYPLPDVFMISSNQTKLKMKPTVFLIVIIKINREGIYLIQSLSHSRILKNWVNTTRLKC